MASRRMLVAAGRSDGACSPSPGQQVVHLALDREYDFKDRVGEDSEMRGRFSFRHLIRGNNSTNATENSNVAFKFLDNVVHLPT